MYVQCHCLFVITDEYLWLFNIIGISSTIFLILFWKREKKLLRRNYVTLETTASIWDVLWQWKAKFQMLGFDSPKQCVQRREGLQWDQEFIRDLLISLPGQLRVQGRQLRRSLRDRSKWAAPLALSAEQGTILQLSDAWTIFPPDALNKCSPITNRGRTNRTGSLEKVIYLSVYFPLCSLNMSNEWLLNFLKFDLFFPSP